MIFAEQEKITKELEETINLASERVEICKAMAVYLKAHPDDICIDCKREQYSNEAVEMKEKSLGLTKQLQHLGDEMDHLRFLIKLRGMSYRLGFNICTKTLVLKKSLKTTL